MYFHGKWMSPFKKELNKKRVFYGNNEVHAETLMMEHTSKFKYFENIKLREKFVEMPDAGADVAITFVLPNERNGLSALEKHMDDGFTTPDYYFPDAHAVIPIFTIKSKIELKPILKALGITDAFENSADINDILTGQSLKISEFVQKAFIEVNEEGTTAAAVTYVRTMSVVEVEPPKQFIADHPFIFYIKIKDVVLFAGRYSSSK